MKKYTKMKSWIETHKPTDEKLRPMYVYVVDGIEVSPYFFSRTVCEAFRKRYDDLSEEITFAIGKLAEYKNNNCKRGVMFYEEYLIPQIEDKIRRFFQDVSNGVFQKKVLNIKNI